MTPEDIDPCLCTHVIYAFSEMENNQLIPTEKHDLKDDKQPGRCTSEASSVIAVRVLVRLFRTIQRLEECEQESSNPAGRRWLGECRQPKWHAPRVILFVGHGNEGLCR